MGGYIGGLMASPNLKWIQSSAAGYEHPIFGEFVKKGAILSTNHSQSVGISEYVLATVLDHFQRGPERRASQADAKWNRLSFREIMKTNWLVIGFGGIGQDVAKRARAFGAHVTGVRRSKGTHEYADTMIGLDDIPSHLPKADVVVLSIPMSKATADLANAKFFASMKKDAVLVNVGRGGLVDEDALHAALDKGTPEFAILDVFKTEPLPSDSWIYKHPRIFMTPHASPDGTGLEARGGEVFVENLRRYLKGELLNNVVSAEEVLGGK
jgi:phosphoglycerate dehydrogenase-like enzyme